MFSRAPNEGTHAANDQNRECPLHFGRVIAEPKKRERNEHRGRDRDKREPGNLPFVGKPGCFFYFAHHQNCNREPANRKSKPPLDTVAKAAPKCRTRKRAAGAKQFNRKLRRFVASTRTHSVSPIGNRQFLKSILLQAPIERASAQAECFRGLARVTIISGQSFLD